MHEQERDTETLLHVITASNDQHICVNALY